MKYSLVLISIILPGLMFAARQNPPRPTRGPTPPPGLPIDQYIYVLIIIAVLIGIIYKKNKTVQS